MPQKDDKQLGGDQQRARKAAQEAVKWKSRFDKAEKDQRDLFKTVAKYYDVLYAVMSTDNIAPWRSKVYIPILASKAWDLIARFSDIEPVFNIKIRNEIEEDEQTGELNYTREANEASEKIQQLMQDEYEESTGEPMNVRLFDTLLDAVVAGSGFAKTPWVQSREKTYVRKFGEDGMTIDDENVIVKTVDTGHNDFQPINFFNMFMPKTARSFYKSPWHIVREYTTYQEAKNTGMYDESQLKKLRKDARQSDTFQSYNRSRNQFTKTGTDHDDTVDDIILYECYENGEIVTYGEGKDSDSPWVEVGRLGKGSYWHGRVPIVPFHIRRKSFSAWGESLFENNARLQSAVNDLFNHYLDNWNLSTDQMLIYEDGSLVGDFIVEPGGEIRYKQGFAAPEQFKFSDPNPNQLSQVLEVIEKGIEQATVPQYLSGVPDSNLDKTAGTATGINKITEAATEKVGFMRNNIKQSMKLVGQNWLSNLQQYMDLPRELAVVKKGIRKPVIVTPGDLQRELTLDIDDDSMRPTTKSEKREATQQFAADLLTFQKAAIEQSSITGDTSDIPIYNFTELIEDSANALSIKDFNKYIKPNMSAGTISDAEAAVEQDAAASDGGGVI